MEDEEEEQVATAEEKGTRQKSSSTDFTAQMATALPIARALLKDVKPPIADAAIIDSLWHYWFDVDKAVVWLRKDWEKKG